MRKNAQSYFNTRYVFLFFIHFELVFVIEKLLSVSILQKRKKEEEGCCPTDLCVIILLHKILLHHINFHFCCYFALTSPGLKTNSFLNWEGAGRVVELQTNETSENKDNFTFPLSVRRHTQ